MGFLSLTNSITTYMQNVADVNNLTVRFDNDPRATPIDNIWLESKIDFENSEQVELGINSFRNFGNLVITIKDSIGLGMSKLFEIADIIMTAFTTVNIDSIIFRVPNIINKGRVEDNWEVEIICPFYIYEN